MIEFMAESSGNILGIRATGKLTDDDYTRALIPKFQALLEEHRKLRVLFYMDGEFKGWELGAAWDDAKFGLKHRDDFDKLAVVGGPRWVDWGIKLSALLMSGEVKTFPSNELPQAWDWLRA